MSGTEGEVVFPYPLAARGILRVTAGVIDAKRQSPVDMVICGKSVPLNVTGKLSEHVVEYACAEPPDRIGFVNMKPLSPRDLGLSGDPRALALAIQTIEVDSVGR